MTWFPTFGEKKPKLPPAPVTVWYPFRKMRSRGQSRRLKSKVPDPKIKRWMTPRATTPFKRVLFSIVGGVDSLSIHFRFTLNSLWIRFECPHDSCLWIPLESSSNFQILRRDPATEDVTVLVFFYGVNLHARDALCIKSAPSWEMKNRHGPFFCGTRVGGLRVQFESTFEARPEPKEDL